MVMDLNHWHEKTDGPGEVLAGPPNCCIRAVEPYYDRAREAAVLAERRRIVTEAQDAIAAYVDAARNLLRPEYAEAVGSAAGKCLEIIAKAGCICPRIDVTSLGGPYTTIPGRDPRCGLHKES